MKQVFRNLWRLPGIYLPLGLSAAICVFLFLLCLSVRNSCDTAIEQLKDRYDVTLTVTLKERLERERDETGKVQIVNRNERRLDSDVFSLLHSSEREGAVDGFSNPYSFETNQICTAEAYAELLACLETGKPFRIGGTLLYDESLRRPLPCYYLQIVACTDEAYLSEAVPYADGELRTVFREGRKFGDGLLLSESVYRQLGEPAALVFGWYDLRGWNVQETETGFTVPVHLLAEYVSLLKNPGTPLVLPVAGYYSGPAFSPVVLCGAEEWTELYSFASSDPSGTPADTIGYRKLRISLPDPSEAGKTISRLVADGLETENYLITADDYDYKFAVSQIAGVRSFVAVLTGTAALLGLLLVLLYLWYAQRKRGEEATVLRALGLRSWRIVLRLAAESGTVLLLGILSGLLAGELFGNAICALVNRLLLADTEKTLENLSATVDFMKNSEAIRARLTQAIALYRNAGVRIEYRVSLQSCLGLLVTWCGAFLCALPIPIGQVTKNIMKGGGDS